ncbi:hypothetical protein Dsin_029768 [Dipteronia sinensis]|uniref:Uncharacterized protein n=1 Tax=Dipteronia sinensis TaxID=43782 RepID=A0AAD9ZUC4_9ROSI|nr:hypothetical protein Dsin_029768 [Dipteronia sinensis]
MPETGCDRHSQSGGTCGFDTETEEMTCLCSKSLTLSILLENVLQALGAMKEGAMLQRHFPVRMDRIHCLVDRFRCFGVRVSEDNI